MRERGTRRRRARTMLAVSSVIVLLAGCAHPGPYTAPLVVAPDQGVSIDAKQRVIFSHDIVVAANKERPAQTYVATCAEPSPDALTAIGVSNGLSLNLGTGPATKAAELSNSISESAASIGLRTQSIQLLRDQMYRLCEGYAAGAMDSAEFKAMQRRSQSTVLGLLAIEQLTGPVVASQALVLASAQEHGSPGSGDTSATNAPDASTSSAGELQAAIRANVASTEVLAQSVRQIVSDINATYLRDECLELMSRLAWSGANRNEDAKAEMAAVEGLCTRLLTQAAEERDLGAQTLLKTAKLKLDQVGLDTLKEEDAAAAAARADPKAAPAARMPSGKKP